MRRPGFTAYAMFAWYPVIAGDTAALSPLEAGSLLAIYAAMGAPGALVLPLIVTRTKVAAVLIVGCAASFATGFAGMLLAPTSTVWLWAVLCGLGQLLFPLSLIMMNARARTTSGTAALSSATQGVDYLFAASGPLVIGLLHEATGSWQAPLIALIAVAVTGTLIGLLAVPRRFIEDVRRA